MHRVLVDGSGGIDGPGSSRICLSFRGTSLRLLEAASTEACRAASWAFAGALSSKSSKPSGEPASLGRTTGIHTGDRGEVAAASVSRVSVSRHEAETLVRVRRCNPALSGALCVSLALAAAVQANATGCGPALGVAPRAPSSGVRPVLAGAEPRRLLNLGDLRMPSSGLLDACELVIEAVPET